MHRTTPKYWRCYEALPTDLQQIADKCYALLRSDPTHPSLHLKKVDKYWSVRVGGSHRALGVEIDEGILWFWIGSHSEYERLING